MDTVMVKTTVVWNDNTQSERVLDILNKDSTAGMMRVFRAALKKGAIRIEIAPYNHNEKK